MPSSPLSVVAKIAALKFSEDRANHDKFSLDFSVMAEVQVQTGFLAYIKRAALQYILTGRPNDKQSAT